MVIPIDQLANNADYLEVCYILLYSETHLEAEYEKFKTTVTRHYGSREQNCWFLPRLRRDAHPMAVMCGVVGALSGDSTTTHLISTTIHRGAAYRLISKMPTLAAMCYKYSIGQPFIYPRNGLGCAERKLLTHDVRKPM
ncbi:hypothetical protein OK016_04145 [Vibrio chagasii]|nr:hypothetical protein [Vibrio chagasii]